VHRSRNERAGLDPIKVARRLWRETRGLGQRRSPRPALPRPDLGRMPLPGPRTQPQRTRKPTPPQRRKKKPAYRIFRAFERALMASVDPRSVLELALVHRLASLLWRLRRARAIKTGLLKYRAGNKISAPHRGREPRAEELRVVVAHAIT
jgi:hypothetical protein